MIKLISDVYNQVITFTKVTKNLKNMDCGGNIAIISERSRYLFTPLFF